MRKNKGVFRGFSTEITDSGLTKTITVYGVRNVLGAWVEGYYIRLNETEHRIYNGFAETDCGILYPDYHTVIEETVCEATDKYDIQDRMIFEHDIVKGFFSGMAYLYEVTCEDGAFGVQWKHDGVNRFAAFTSFIKGAAFEVVGNRFDNPELLLKVYEE